MVEMAGFCYGFESAPANWFLSTAALVHGWELLDPKAPDDYTRAPLKP